ncbi:hypothetical protein BUZ14_04345 [Staphylococcus gallinarum]|uniref:Uncharacterized protein n=1 Tax=Staphylococcus gallinarum TaxID=1293 RepID=A0A3A0VPN6_STAGA|nr:hypothetical protein [Staphylococcus gallinarum]RIP35888.1 hypothetical protein BUZ14_04345 [Staphylococcus gallinarum]
MANNEEPKVLAPGDKHYKDKDYFKHNQHNTNKHDTKGYSRHYHYGTRIGCGPFGCFSGCMILIFLPIIIIYLLQLFF